LRKNPDQTIKKLSSYAESLRSALVSRGDSYPAVEFQASRRCARSRELLPHSVRSVWPVPSWECQS